MTVPWSSNTSVDVSSNPTGIAVDTVGNVYTCGNFMTNPLRLYDPAGTLTNTLGKYATTGPTTTGFIVKYNTSGNRLWAARIGGYKSDLVNHIAADLSNNVIVTGTYASSPLKIFNYDGYSV